MLFQRGRHVVLKSFLQENLALDRTLSLGLGKQFNFKNKFKIQLISSLILTSRFNSLAVQKWL